jgi:hypothetical protein
MIDLDVPYSENGLQGDIKSNAMGKLCKIPNEAFLWFFQQWQNQWSKRVCTRVLV